MPADVSSGLSGTTTGTSTSTSTTDTDLDTGEEPPYDGEAAGCGDGIPVPNVYCFKKVTIGDIPLGPSVIGDLNGDSNLDIAILPGTHLAIALGDGNGLLELMPELYLTGHTVAPSTELRLGDFGGDGVWDIAVVTSNEVAILHGTGDGSFGMGEIHTLNANWPIMAIDVDQDGQSDLVAQRFGDTPQEKGISVFLRTGDTFTETSMLPHPTACYVANFLATDLDGDDRSDLLAVGGCNSVFPDTPVGVYLAFQNKLQFVGEIVAGIDPVAPSSGDFSGDNIADVIVGSGAGCDVSLLAGVGNGEFAANEELELSPTGKACRTLMGAHLAQLDGLGRDEILVDYFPGEDIVSTDPRRFYAAMDIKGANEVWLWLAEGSIMEIGDLNNDGVDDVLFRDLYEMDQLSILLSNP